MTPSSPTPPRTSSWRARSRDPCTGWAGDGPSPERAPRRLVELRWNHSPLVAGAFSPNGRLLAIGAEDGQVALWDVGDPARPHRLVTLRASTAAIHAVSFTADGRFLVTVSGEFLAVDGNPATIWDISRPAAPLARSSARSDLDWLLGAALSPDSRILAMVGFGTANLWDLSDPVHPRRVAYLAGSNEVIYAAVFDPTGRLLATASQDRTVRLWDVTQPTKPTLVATLGPLSTPLFTVGFSSDGRYVATGSGDGATMVWDIRVPASPRPSTTLHGSPGAVQSLAFVPGRAALINGDENGGATVWDLTDNTAFPRVVTRAGGSIESFRATADGQVIATSARGTGVTLWRPAADGRFVRITEGTAPFLGPTAPGSLAAPLRLGGTGVRGDSAAGIAFLSDRLLTTDGAGEITSLDTRSLARTVTDPVARACATISRGFNPSEWARYAPGQPFQRTC